MKGKHSLSSDKVLDSKFPENLYICGVEEKRVRFQNSQKAFDNFQMAIRGLRFQRRA